MHDPMVVAFDVPTPFPHRSKWREENNRKRGVKHWGFVAARYTNKEHLGQRINPWYSPKGYTLFLGHRQYTLRKFATIWHVEPGGADSGEVCKHWKKVDGENVVDKSWRWHVHHWKIQLPWLQHIRRRLFDRCEMCKRPLGPKAPTGFSWDGEPKPKHVWQSHRGLYHSECASLRQLRTTLDTDVEVVHALVEWLGETLGADERSMVLRLTSTDGIKTMDENGNFTDSFRVRYRLQNIMGYQYDQGNYDRFDKKEVFKAERDAAREARMAAADAK